MKSALAFISTLICAACVSAALFYFVLIHRGTGSAPALRVKAVAHQWWWEFDYPSLGVKTSDVLYLPSRTDVRLELNSGDVIHSFWIAGMKNSVEIIPGKARLLSLFVESPGELYGNCDSGCGCAAVCMRFRVLASSPVEFQRWAVGARLARAQFKPPAATGTPDCALETGHDGHVMHNAPASRLQQLLDKSSTASHLTH